MPEATSSGAPAATPASRPSIPLLDSARDYSLLYNYVKAVRQLLGKGGEFYRSVKTQHPDIDARLSTGNLRDINNVIFENSSLVGLGGIQQSEFARIANYSKVLANAEVEGNKVPSLNAVDRVKADYDRIMQEKLEQGEEMLDSSEEKVKAARKEKNKANWKVAGRVVLGVLAAALSLGLLGGFGLGVYGIVQTAIGASFTLTSGFAVGGVALALVTGRWIVKGIGTMFSKIREAFGKANAERKEKKKLFRAAKRALKQNRRNDLANQYAISRDRASEEGFPYPGRTAAAPVASMSRAPGADMVSAAELAAITREIEADLAREASELPRGRSSVEAESVDAAERTEESAAEPVRAAEPASTERTEGRAAAERTEERASTERDARSDTVEMSVEYNPDSVGYSVSSDYYTTSSSLDSSAGVPPTSASAGEKEEKAKASAAVERAVESAAEPARAVKAAAIIDICNEHIDKSIKGKNKITQKEYDAILGDLQSSIRIGAPKELVGEINLGEVLDKRLKDRGVSIEDTKDMKESEPETPKSSVKESEPVKSIKRPTGKGISKEQFDRLFNRYKDVATKEQVEELVADGLTYKQLEEELKGRRLSSAKRSTTGRKQSSVKKDSSEEDLAWDKLGEPLGPSAKIILSKLRAEGYSIDDASKRIKEELGDWKNLIERASKAGLQDKAQELLEKGEFSQTASEEIDKLIKEENERIQENQRWENLRNFALKNNILLNTMFERIRGEGKTVYEAEAIIEREISQWDELLSSARKAGLESQARELLGKGEYAQNAFEELNKMKNDLNKSSDGELGSGA